MKITTEKNGIYIKFDSDSEDSIARRLTLARIVRGLSQTELAERVGVRSASISGYESGKASPSVDVLIKLAKALNVSLDYLCSIDIKMED